MKLHITAKQLHELSLAAKLRLRARWLPAEGDFILVEDCIHQVLFYGSVHSLGEGNFLRCEDGDFRVSESLPLLSVGQLFEIIQETFGKGFGMYGFPPTLTPGLADQLHEHGGYVVKVIPTREGRGIFGSSEGYLSRGQEELCDALWEGVKFILERAWEN